MIDQIAIPTLGVVAIYLTNDPRPTRRKWASLLGLVAQPFWFYATWKAQQWGIFAATFLYTYSWARGFYFAWIKT